jgi:hypothetical protein
MTLSITGLFSALSIMSFSITTLSIMTFSITTQHNDNQYNDTQHNDIQHNNKLNVALSINDTQRNNNAVMLSVNMLSVTLIYTLC